MSAIGGNFNPPTRIRILRATMTVDPGSSLTWLRFLKNGVPWINLLTTYPGDGATTWTVQINDYADRGEIIQLDCAGSGTNLSVDLEYFPAALG